MSGEGVVKISYIQYQGGRGSVDEEVLDGFPESGRVYLCLEDISLGLVCPNAVATDFGLLS